MKLNLICERKNSGSEKESDKKDFISFEKSIFEGEKIVNNAIKFKL